MNYKVDASSTRPSEYMVTSRKRNLKRVYWDIKEVEKEEGEEKEKYISYESKFIERVSLFETALEVIKEEILEQLSAYDESENVNSFTVNGYSMWLTKSERAGLRMRLDAEEGAGKESTTLWAGVLSISLPIDTAKSLLQSLEIYASECYDKTAEHKANITALTDISEIGAYDYTTGYPDKLEFTI